MAIWDVGDRISFDLDSGEGLDDQGYALTQGDDGGDTVKKATTTDNFIGVNFRSTQDSQDEEVLTGATGIDGARTAVEREGVVNLYCVAGNEYNPGETVYLSSTPGVADKNPDTAATGSDDDTAVGRVVRYADLTGADGPEHVAVSITEF